MRHPVEWYTALPNRSGPADLVDLVDALEPDEVASFRFVLKGTVALAHRGGRETGGCGPLARLRCSLASGSRGSRAAPEQYAARSTSPTGRYCRTDPAATQEAAGAANHTRHRPAMASSAGHKVAERTYPTRRAPPPISTGIAGLVGRLATENHGRGCQRNQGELLKLGHLRLVSSENSVPDSECASDPGVPLLLTNLTGACCTPATFPVGAAGGSS
jgi:hypothetical protein